MPVASKVELVNALQSGNYDSIIGTPESGWLDFKRQPYDLDKPKDRWELAKDAAALASARGGLIVLGFSTAREPTLGIDRVDEVRPIPSSLIDMQRYRGHLEQWIYPALRGVKLHWYGDSAEKGVTVIEVPPQSPSSLPFLVRALREDDRELVAFGAPRRDGDRTQWTPVGRIHHWLRLGMATAASPPQATSAPHPDPADALVERLGWSCPYYTISAVPEGGRGPIQKFYGPEGLQGRLENPDSLREGGFNLARGTPTDRVGQALAVLDGGCAVWLDRDGSFAIAAAGTPDRLGYHLTKTSPPLFIHPLVLVETTLEFFRFLNNEVQPLVRAADWRVRARCVRFKEGEARLAAGPFKDLPPQLQRGHRAAGDDCFEDIDWSKDPGIAALRTLVAVYAVFGLPATAVPYTEGDRVSESLVVRR